mgnify:CR=1 FL=1
MKNDIAEEHINNCLDELNIIKEDISKNKLARINKFLI